MQKLRELAHRRHDAVRDAGHDAVAAQLDVIRGRHAAIGGDGLRDGDGFVRLEPHTPLQQQAQRDDKHASQLCKSGHSRLVEFRNEITDAL